MLIQLVGGIPSGSPVVESNFRQLFPHISFPSPLTPASLDGTNFGLYEYSPVPSVKRYEKVVETTPQQDVQGVWRQHWDVVDMDEQERIEADKEKSNEVYAQRNYLLLTSDWTQLNDSPLDSHTKLLWAEYREQLRAVPQQPGFPWDVIWPIKPPS